MSDANFALLLKDLESYFKCPLKPDSTGCCLIEMPSGILIQLSMDKYKENFCMATRLGIMPSHGNYRENLFKTALIANGDLPLSSGIVAFSSESNNLILFQKIHMKGITSRKISDSLDLFMANAEKWIKAVNSGQLPIFEEKDSSKPGFFGLVR